MTQRSKQSAGGIMSTCPLLSVVILVVVLTLGYATDCVSGNPMRNFRSKEVVVVSRQEEVRERIILNPKPVMVLVLDESNTQVVAALAEVINVVSEELQGLVETVVMASTSEAGEATLSSFGLTNIPALLLFNTDLTLIPDQPGSLIRLPISFQGGLSSEMVLRWVVESLSHVPVERIGNMQEMAAFLRKFSNLPKMPSVLYLTNSTVVSPMYLSLAQRLRYGASFGVVLGAASEKKTAIMQTYEVTRLPAIIVISRVDDKNDEVIAMPDVSAQTTIDDITGFVAPYILTAAEQENIKPQIIHQEEILIRKGKERPKKTVEPIVVTTQTEFDSECMRIPRNHFCIIVFADSIEHAQSRLPMMAAASKRIIAKSPSPVHIVLLDGSANYEMMAYFDANNGTPDIVVVNAGTKSYVNFVGSFSESGIANFFLNRGLTAPGKKFITKQVPHIVESGGAGQGSNNNDGDSDDEDL